MKKLESLLVLLSLGMTVGCKTVNPTSKIKSDSIDYLQRRLASGFDSEQLVKLSPCVEGTPFVYSGANSSEFTFFRDYSYDDILDELGGGIYAQASLFGLASAKIEGDMASSLATTDDSASFVYQFSIRGKSALLDTVTFNPKGISAYNRNDPIFFRSECGDQFVDRVTLTGQLFVGVKYTFTSKETKEEVKLKISAELFWGLIKVSKTWDKETKELLKNLMVTVEAYQVGGDPRRLEALKAQTKQAACRGDDLAVCANALDKLLVYGRDDFPSQLDNEELTDNPDSGLAITTVGTVNYADYLIYEPKAKAYVRAPRYNISQPSQELDKATQELSGLIASLNMAASREAALENFNLSQNEKNNLILVKQDLAAALSQANDVLGNACRKAIGDKNYLQRCVAGTGDVQKKFDNIAGRLSIPNRT